MKKYFLFFLFSLILFPGLNAQSLVEAKKLAYVAAEGLMQKVSPFSGHDSSAEILNADFDGVTGKYEIEMAATWEGSPCFLCDNTTFEVRGFLTVGRNGSGAEFMTTYKNQAVTDAEFWNDLTNVAITLGTLIIEEEMGNSQVDSQSPPEQVDSSSPVIQSSGKGKIYAVVAGVSNYKFIDNDLEYCDDDARSFYEVMVRQAGKENVTLLTDQDAGKFAILQAVRDQFMKAGPDDKIIFFFSGHGDKGYLLPVDFQGDGSNALLFDEIRQIYKKSRAGDKYIFADACMAGSIRVDLSPETEDNTPAGNSSANVLVYMSSRGTQISKEAGELENGVFSFYLVRALRGAADSNRDRCITAKELYSYTSTRVKQFVGAGQIPVMWGRFGHDMPVLCW